MLEYKLMLFIDGERPSGQRALQSVQALLTGQLGDRCELEVIDVRKAPERVDAERIMTTPTLVRMRGAERRLVVGDMSRPDIVLRGLALPHSEATEAASSQVGAMSELMASHHWPHEAAHRFDAWIDMAAHLGKKKK